MPLKFPPQTDPVKLFVADLIEDATIALMDKSYVEDGIICYAKTDIDTIVRNLEIAIGALIPENDA